MSRQRVAALVACMALVAGACNSATATPSPTSGGTTGPTATIAPTPTPTAAPVTLTYLTDDSAVSHDIANAIAAAYHQLHPNVTIAVETRPQGTDGDNVVKTRLATGDMDDMFFYNSGSLLQALQPATSLVDLTGQKFLDNVQSSFFPTVADGTGKGIYGVPTQTAMGGGILYNKKVYSKLGLSVPKTWAEFEANNTKIKAAGITPVEATFGDTWTSQLFVLADYYNVAQAVPTFAADYTGNKAKYATTPAALNGFNYLAEGFTKGWYEKDFAVTKYADGLKAIANGTAAHYPMLTFALSTIATDYPDKVNDIGFFAVPGTDASKNGATIWMPAATYIPKTSKHIPEALDVLAFIASPAGAAAITAKVAPTGPYVIKGAVLPDNVLPAVKEIAAYIDAGKSSPALEFLSPLKGPTLEQICVAVGSGQTSAADGAAAYDKDVEKAAKQLGLAGW